MKRQLLLLAFMLFGISATLLTAQSTSEAFPKELVLGRRATFVDGVLRLNDWPEATLPITTEGSFKITYVMKIVKKKHPTKAHFGFTMRGDNRDALFHTDANTFIGTLSENGRKIGGAWAERGTPKGFKDDQWNTVEITVRPQVIAVNVNGNNSVMARFALTPVRKFGFHSYNYTYDIQSIKFEALEEKAINAEPQAVFSAPFNGSLTAKIRDGKELAPAKSANTAFAQGVKGQGVTFAEKTGVLEYALENPFDSNIGGFMFWCRLNGKQSGKLFAFTEGGKEVITANLTSERMIINVLRHDTGKYITYTRTLPGIPLNGNWYHIALSWNSDNKARFYINALPWWVSFTPGQRCPDFVNAQVDKVDGLKFHNATAATIADVQIFHRTLTNQEVYDAYRQVMPIDMVSDNAVIDANAPARASVLVAPDGYFTRPLPVRSVEAKPVKVRLAFQITNKDGKALHEEEQEITVNEPQEVFLKPVTLPVGNYHLNCTINYGKNSYKRSYRLAAYSSPKENTQSTGELKIGKLVYERILDDANAADIQKEGPVTKVQNYLQAGNAKGQRFSFEIPFPSEVQGKPVVLEIEWPDDAIRSMGWYMYPWGLGVNRDRLQVGIQSGREYPNSGKLIRTRHIFYPGSEKYLFEARTMAANRPAAVHAVRVYTIDGDLPRLTINKPAGLPNRRFGHADEDQTFNNNLNIDAYINKKSPLYQQLHEQFPVSDTFFNEELKRYFNYAGMNAMHYPLWRYTTTFVPLEGHTAAGLYATNPGMLPYTFNFFAKNDLKFVAKLYYTNLPDAGLGDKVDYDMLKEGLVNQNRYGEHVYDPVRNGGLVANLAHPETHQRFASYFQDMVKRYSKIPGFDGISYLPQGCGIWINLEWGYDDYTTGKFTRDTGIAVPKEITKRYDFLTTGEVRKSWLKWRAQQVTDFIAKTRKILDNADPRLKLFVALPAGKNRYEKQGVDMEAIQKIPGVQIQLTTGSTEHRWRSHWGVAEGTYLEEYFDFNRPDYQQMRQNGSIGCVDIFNRYHETFVRPIDNRYNCYFESSDPKPHGRFFLRDLVFAVGSFDAQEIVQGGQPLPTIGRDDESREFARAYCALPELPFTQIPGIHDPAVARYCHTKNGTYFYVANMFHHTVKVRLEGAKKYTYQDLSTGKMEKDQVITLQPFQLRSFLIPEVKAQFKSLSFVETTKEAHNFYRQRLEQLHSALKVLLDAKLEAGEESQVVAAMEKVMKDNQWAELYRLSFCDKMEALLQKSADTGKLVTRQKMLQRNYIAINCGGSVYIPTDKGDYFLPDQPYDGKFGHFGRYTCVARELTDQSMKYPEIYKSEAYDHDGYKFNLPAGKYLLRGYFKCGFKPSAKPDYHVFDLHLNGKTLLANFDVYKECGNSFDKPVVKEFIVDHDGKEPMELRFIYDRKRYSTVRLINAIEVIPQ